MTSPPPYPAPKRLERSRSNRVLGGVCAGIANYLNMDPTLVRVLTVVISFFTGVPIVIYLVLMLVLPEEQEQAPQPGVSQAGSAGYGQPIPPTTRPTTDPVWGPAGAPWEQQAATAPPVPTPPTTTPPGATPPAQAAQPTPAEGESGQREDRPGGNSLR